MTPTLEGPHLRLEPLTLAHLPALEQVAFDPAIWRYVTAPVKTPADLRTWADTALRLQTAGTGMPWVTILKATGKPIGSTRYIDLDLHHKTVEIGGTWLIPAHQGTGQNAEAKLLQLDYAFNVFQLHRVAFKTHHENLRSQAAIRKLGAAYEGTFRNHYLMSDGRHRHSVWFSIIREEWPQLRSQLVTRLPR